MCVRKSWFRIGLGLLGAGGIAASTLGVGTIHAHATGSLTITPTTVAGTACHNLNPDLEINTTALTAVADGPGRGYSQISSVTVGAGPVIDGISQAAITVNLCGAVPTFPLTNGDTGAEYYLCFSPSPNEAIASGRYGNVVGNGAISGDPIFDGPYPKSQGWRLCAWASINAGVGVDFGVAYYDPIALFTFLDPANLFDGTPATPTITKTTLASGVTSFTMYLPYIWRSTANGGLPTQVVESSQVLSPSDVSPANDFVAESEVAFNVGLPSPPAPVCAPTTSICVQGIVGELVPVDFAPGYEVCTAPLQGCAQYGPLGFDLGVENNFPVSAIETCVNPVNPPGNNPASPLLTCDVASFPNTPATGGPPPKPGPAGQQVPYTTIFQYGRILPGPIVPLVSPVGSGAISPFGQFIDDGLTFAA
jgi:hypothetical protein